MRNAMTKISHTAGLAAGCSSFATRHSSRQLARLVEALVEVRWVGKQKRARDVGQDRKTAPVRRRQGEIRGRQNLKPEPRLALQRELELPVGPDKGLQKRFADCSQADIVHVPV